MCVLAVICVESVGRGGWWCVKVGGRADRVSGTKPPPKINAVPASLCLSSGRPAGSLSSSGSRVESGARRPVTGTTCHQLHRSPNGSTLDQRYGRQYVAPPRRQFTLQTHTHTLWLSTPSHLQASSGETRRPPYNNSQGCWR